MIRNILSELYSEGSNPNWWRRWLLYRVNAGFQTRVWPGRKGIDVKSADWDTLIVCDACRADLFTETDAPSWFNEYTEVTSLASTTSEWLNHNFPNSHGEIVYVAGNPMVSLHKPETFHELVEIWRDGWDAKENIIRAEPVTKAAIEARERHPNKRLVIHYMQPHAPFFGHPELHYMDYSKMEGIEGQGQNKAGNIWEAVKRGYVDEKSAWEGYIDNLQYVLQEVKQLLECEQMGRSIVTSDHGNVFTKRSYPIPFRYSGHPIGHRDSELVTVPWGIQEASGERPDIADSGVSSHSDAEQSELDERLGALGYR